MTIKLLPEEIINQIAAGEVIENPAAVIKELIENSIDAKATQIDIEVEQAGFKKIILKDNGIGISKEDLLKAPLRHATSKIETFNDLYNIKTMGFRGEALASIFSVSQAKIVSKIQNSDISYEISSQNINEIKKSASQVGTTIHIVELFYNTPARKKYMKSENLELKAIVDTMNRFIVNYENIKFTLKHNGKILINKPQFKTKEENLYYVLGKDLKENLLYFENEMQGLKISGFIGKPSNISYPYKKNQYIYVNSRYVKSKLISDSIYEGFGTNLMSGRHPFYVISIEIDPEIVDVNVHPTKIEIRFENELEIYEFIKNSIKKVFEKNETFKPFETQRKEKNYSLNEIVEDLKAVKNYSISNEQKSSYTTDTQKPLNVKEEISSYSTFQSSIFSPSIPQFAQSHIPFYGPLYDILKDYRIVGQINKTFIIIETPNEMILLDQHVAEEKFFYENFKEQIETKKPKSQLLLKPVMLTFSNSEMLIYSENIFLIEQLGFKTEKFGTSEVLVRAVPIGLNNLEVNPMLLKDIIGEITIDKKFKSLEDEKLEKLASMACKKSIKAGDEMTTPQIHKMIENLKKLKEPFNCPHGRPIMLRYTFTDLEKKFKRIV